MIKQVRETLKQLLTDRGYTNVPLLGENDTEYIQCNALGVPDLLIIAANTESVGISWIQNAETRMERLGIRQCILVSTGKITSKAKKRVEHLIVEKKNIQTFLADELLSNITHHIWVPKHRKMSDKEIATIQWLDRPKLLPRISSNDPVSKYYDFKRNDIIEITRYSESVGQTVLYRIVV